MILFECLTLRQINNFLPILKKKKISFDLKFFASHKIFEFFVLFVLLVSFFFWENQNLLFQYAYSI